MTRFQERAALLLLLILGLAPRLVIISRFPTIPVSDFRGLVAFGLDLRDHGLTYHSAGWEFLNPGLPLILSGLFRLAPSASPDGVARLATALAAGLLPTLPLVIWRGVLPLWVRLAAGASLALWPGQILFSGVVAQDNWVLVPTVALGALAVRVLVTRQPVHPIIAGLVYAAGVAIRQEMLVVLLPLFLAATGVCRVWQTDDEKRSSVPLTWQRMVVVCLAAGLPLLSLAAYRHASTGRFALSSEEAGVAILSSYIPGANAAAYAEPYAYVASVRPDLLRDHKSFFPYASRLALQEALRRPAFHAVRILSWVCTFAVAGEARSLYWGLNDEALPEALRNRGDALAVLSVQPLKFELAAIQGLFLAAVIIAIRRRNRAILALALAVLLKYGLHAVTAAQGRYFYPATALEILGIAIAAHEARAMWMQPERWWLLRGFAAGLALSLGLLLFAPMLEAFVQSRDIDRQRTYHFRLLLPVKAPSAALNCVVKQGSLYLLEFPWSATLRTFQPDPAPGDVAAALCELTGLAEARPLMLQVLDPYAAGGLPGRMMQRVELDGVEVYSHDVAQTPGSGWANIPLGDVGKGTKRRVVIEVKAVHPDPGAYWGAATRTTFRLAESPFASHLAVGRPSTQSSTLPGYESAGALEAVDGNTDGNFFDGSVTSTNRDINAWWEVDLGASVPIGYIVIWNRTDCCSDRLEDFWIFVSDAPFRPTDTPATLRSRPGTWSSHQTSIPRPSVRITTSGLAGRYIRVQLSGTNHLSLAEVQVFGR